MTEIHIPTELRDALHGKNSIVMHKAKWCGHCQRHEPVFREQSERFPQVQFLVFDMDENRESMPQNMKALSDSVESYPTVMMFKNDHGKMRAYKYRSGARDDAAISNMVKMMT